MPAGIYNITAEQGATLSRTLTWKNNSGTPINLTNYTARMQVREQYSSTVVLLSLTTENGGITLGGALGTIVLFASASSTAGLVAGSYVYDLELVTGGTVTRLIQGNFVVNAEVTR